jgi:ComF family protein
VAEIFCAQCGAAFLSASSLDAGGRCRLCAAGATAFSAAYCFGEYCGILRDLIHLLKYRRIRPLAEPLGRMMSRALPPQSHHDALVPMPLHWRRRFIRGFNQAELLARVVSRRTGLPIPDALSRSRHTSAQAELASASQRRANVRGVFVVRRPELAAGKRIILADDVLTTGATVNSAAAALLAAGAARVDVLTLARADRRRPIVQYQSVVQSLSHGGTA